MTSERELAAWHEAGHAVAAVMRGNLLLSATLGEQHGSGITWHRGHAWDEAFIAFAGPWAEARYLWGDRPLEECDEDGLSFEESVWWVSLHQPSDAEAVRAGWRAQPWVTPEMAGASEEVWASELDDEWAAIAGVAELILAGTTVSHEDVVEARLAAIGVR